MTRTVISTLCLIWLFFSCSNKPKNLEYVEKLLLSESISLSYSVIGSGTIDISLSGLLKKDDSHFLLLTADGYFGEKPVSVQMSADRDSLYIQSLEKKSAYPRPMHLNEAVMVGFMRMGIMHNLARLSYGMIPDRADGSVYEWVEYDSVNYSDSRYTFDVIVSGVKSAQAELWLNNRNKPVKRLQYVSFPDGVLKVEETFNYLDN